MSRIRGLHAAWDVFCGEVDFDPAATLVAYGISFSALERGEVFDEDGEAKMTLDLAAQADPPGGAARNLAGC